MILMVLLALLSPASAQSTSERAACRADAIRYCKDKFESGDVAVGMCLAEHRSQLKPACRVVLTSHGL